VRATAESIPHKHLLKRTVRFGPSTCFLCSAPLRSKNRSDEHVFPKWLQNRFNLWNQRLDLINQTSIPYKQLTIPCCKTCNNEHLSKLENIMREAVAQGPQAVDQLPPATVYMWLSKIFYGILYRESLLRADRRRGKRPIVPKEVLAELRLHHDFMQGIRRSLEFPHGIPGSILVFGTSVPSRIESQFDFLDNHENRSIALRMGSVGIVCILQDGAMTKGFHDHLGEPYYRDRPLHPMQFREVTALAFYKAMLLDSTALYIIAETPEKMQIVTQMPPAVSFREWDWLTFCRMLGYYWNQPVEQIYGGEIGWASSLKGQSGEFLTLDPNAHYSFLVPDKWKEATNGGSDQGIRRVGEQKA
jgi:hypothetical protein